MNVRETKTERLEARVSPQTKELFARAAELEGLSLTEFLVSAASARARRVVRADALLVLSERDQAAFAAALLNPPKPSERLLEAARRFSASGG